MKRLFCVAVALAAASVMSAQEAAETAASAVGAKEEQPSTGFSFDATLDLYSAYIWHGLVVNDRPVWEPAGTLAYATEGCGKFAVGAWANFEMTGHNGNTTGAGLNEIDYTASYLIDISDFTVEAGHIWYTFPKVCGPDAPSTREVYGSVTYNSDIVTPSLSVYYDYALMDGAYALAALNKTVELNERVSVGTEVALGAGSEGYMAYFGVTEAGLLDFNASAFASYKLTDHLSVGAKLAWLSIVDNAARESVDHQELLWGGVNLAASF
ncbi:MAG: hypothetical protein WCK89_16385 [bacterium]